MRFADEMTCVFLISVLSFAPACFGADDDDVDEEKGVKKYGVVYDMASDRRINRIGGVYEPEDLDKYMKRRFDSIDSQIGAISGKVDALQSSLDEMQKRLEALAPEKESPGQKSGEAPKSSPRATLVR